MIMPNCKHEELKTPYCPECGERIIIQLTDNEKIKAKILKHLRRRARLYELQTHNYDDSAAAVNLLETQNWMIHIEKYLP